MPEESRGPRIYTRSGDEGTTSLFGGGRVPKDHPRVSAYGAVDELNSVIGVAVAFMDDERLTRELAAVQNELFNIGSELASETAGEKAAAHARMFAAATKKIAAMERLLDELDSALPPLQTFILPSGSKAGALLHLCRTVSRRAERELVSLNRLEPVNPEILAYMNRLSDILFVMARYVNQKDGVLEKSWHKNE